MGDPIIPHYIRIGKFPREKMGRSYYSTSSRRGGLDLMWKFPHFVLLLSTFPVAFKGVWDGLTYDCCEHGDRVPAIHLHKKGKAPFDSHFTGLVHLLGPHWTLSGLVLWVTEENKMEPKDSCASQTPSVESQIISSTSKWSWIGGTTFTLIRGDTETRWPEL